MGRPSKGARLYLRHNRVDPRSGSRLAAIYFIRDGSTNRSTGFGPDRLEEAEEALAAYLDARRRQTLKARATADDPADVLIADVVALYAREKAPLTADPKSVAGRLSIILEWWGAMTLADIRRSTCLGYVAHREGQPIRAYKNASSAPRVSAASARRELEDLSSAVTWWAAEHPLTRRPIFTYPATTAGSPRDALSRADAAALLWASMGWRKGQDGRWRRLSKSAIANRRHLRRFILLGLYSGSRPGVLPKLRWRQADDAAWVDLSKGWIYRRGRREADHPTKKRPAFRIPKRLYAHLRRWERLDALRSAALQAQGEPALDTVLHHGGAPISGKLRTGYRNIVKDAGLAPGITPHYHRHTAATWLMEQDVSVRRAAQYLGMTPRTLEKHYAHHRPGFQTDISDAMARGGRRDS